MNFKNSLYLSKAEKLALVENLEKLYAIRLFQHDFHKKYDAKKQKKTAAAESDRQYRVGIKACEVLLYELGSKLFENVEQRPSIRRTLEVTTRHDRAVQSKWSLVSDKSRVVHRQNRRVRIPYAERRQKL